jgi:hypothetical protein
MSVLRQMPFQRPACTLSASLSPLHQTPVLRVPVSDSSSWAYCAGAVKRTTCI